MFCIVFDKGGGPAGCILSVFHGFQVISLGYAPCGGYEAKNYLLSSN